jgi:hypothetical protein
MLPSFYPKPTGDVARDRKARLSNSPVCRSLFALAAIAVVDMIAGELLPLPIMLVRSAYLRQRP